MTTAGSSPQPITFAEWSYLGKGVTTAATSASTRLTQMSALRRGGHLFADLGSTRSSRPISDHGPLTVADIAGGGRHD